MRKKPNAVVIGSGPNGLAAAIVLAQAGCTVEVRETAPAPGGATRTAELTLPGFLHDLGSAVHPMAISSPFFSTLPLTAEGLEWIHPPAPLAHPLDDGSAVIVERDLNATASQFGADSAAYRKLLRPLADHWDELTSEILRPMLHLPRHPLLLASFGTRAIQPAAVLARNTFRNARARALFAGLAAHSSLRLESPLSAAFGVIMAASAHAVGWPIAKGGSQSIANSLCRVLKSLGGQILTNSRVVSLDELGPRDLILCDITPRQFLSLAGNLPAPFRELLARFQYGPGVFKVDWALREPIPWRAKDCLHAATVHLGGSLEEIAESERDAWRRRPPRRPFVILVQPTLFDPTRAPAGKHTAWAYCHVPNGWQGSAVDAVEDQIERFAPGFRECILARSVYNPADMERWNENLVGGDKLGGAPTLKQSLLRPTWRLYGTPLKGVYLCSSATPPGGAVHGMCGYWAAHWALRDLDRGSGRS
jgi:phytoene dehydrogenase-like protein